MRLDRIDRWLGPALVAAALAWLWLALEFIPGARQAGEPGPRAFPVLLGAVLALLGALLTAAAWRGAGRAAGDEVERAGAREAWIAGGTFGLLLLYAFLLDKLGFLVATPVAVVLAMAGLLGLRNWLLTGALAAGLTLGCWALFVWLLKAPLPRGLWLM